MTNTTTTTTTKLTKAQKFDMLLAIEEVKTNPILVEFINHEKELIAKKNAADRKPTKTQVANDELRKQILDFMEIGKAYTASEIQKALGVEKYTLPKVTAVLRPMLTVTAKEEVNPDGVIERFMEKGVAYFRKLDIETAEDED